MNRSKYFNLIEEKLDTLAYRIEVRGGLNILDLNLYSENFYLDLFKLLYGWDLTNLNATQQNVAGIDLIDKINKLIVQVSSTATKQKVVSALNKDLSAYKHYSFKFISISKNAKNLRTKTFKNPHNLIFSPIEDIYDIPSILKFVLQMNIDQQKNIYEFLIKELKTEPDPEKIESNLTTIILILSKEDWNQGSLSFETIPYDIDAKISYNQLGKARTLIDEYKFHYSRIDKIYAIFDKQGANKSLSILNGIRTEYLTLGSVDSPDQCFFSIIDKVAQKIRMSANYKPIPDEELILSVQILVVDAFIRCKIFKNPMENTNANS
jgi:hypothetical protein